MNRFLAIAADHRYQLSAESRDGLVPSQEFDFCRRLCFRSLSLQQSHRHSDLDSDMAFRVDRISRDK